MRGHIPGHPWYASVRRNGHDGDAGRSAASLAETAAQTSPSVTPDPLGNNAPETPALATEVGFSDLEPDMDLLLDPLRDFDTDEERW